MLHVKVIHERTFTLSMGDVVFAGNREMSFFAMPLAQTWLATPLFTAGEHMLVTSKVGFKVAPGQAYHALTIVPKNGMNQIRILSVKAGQFIPFFGTFQSSLLRGHMAKKGIPLSLICIASPHKDIDIKRPAHVLLTIYLLGSSCC
jgi:hypothetical protein